MNKHLLSLIERVEETAFELGGDAATPFLQLLTDLNFAVNSVQNGYGLARRDKDENPAEVLDELRENITAKYITEHVDTAAAIAEHCQAVRVLCSMLRQEMAGR